MAFDPSNGETVLFGGFNGSDPLNDTWTYALQVDPPTAEITSPTDGGTYTAGQTVPTEFSCEEALGGPGLASCEDSNADEAPDGHLDTTSLGPHTYTVTATSQNGLSGTDQINYEVVKASPSLVAADAGDTVVGNPITVEADLTEGANATGGITFSAYGPHDDTCSASPAFESSPVAVAGDGEYESPGFTPDRAGAYRWVASYSGDANNDPAESACDDPGSVSELSRAVPIVTASGATNAEFGGPISVKAEFSGGFEPGGEIIFSAHALNDPGCTTKSVFQSDPIPVNGAGTYDSPEFTPTEPGAYRWLATYLGDENNDSVENDCDAPGSVSTVTELPPDPPVCPDFRSALRLQNTKPSRPFGNGPKTFGMLIRVRTGFDSSARIKPAVRYRVSGRTRTVRLKQRTIRIRGSRMLRFRVPPEMKRDFKRAGKPLRRARVTFRMGSSLKPRTSPARCFRSAGTKSLRTRVTGVSRRVALRRIG